MGCIASKSEKEDEVMLGLTLHILGAASGLSLLEKREKLSPRGVKGWYLKIN